MYNYQEQRKKIFTEEGQVLFIKVRDKVHQHLNMSGAFMMENILNGITGNSWDTLACVDRLVELKEIREVTDGSVAGQHRVFVKRNY